MVQFPPAQLVECTHDRHAPAILAIMNDAIVNSTALYDYEPRALASMTPWFDAKARGGFPVLGAENEAGELLGFATYGTFRAWPAYKYSVEHSVYVADGARARGVGFALMRKLLEVAQTRDVHTVIGGIDAANTASIAFHEKLGFTHAGTLREAGFKFGRWLDLAFYQLVLPSPKAPRDG